VIDCESRTCTFTSLSTAVAALWADCMVAESPDDRLMQTTESAPASSCLRKAASKAPGEGAAVSGRAAEAAIRR
jgi:hypothetical protein